MYGAFLKVFFHLAAPPAEFIFYFNPLACFDCSRDGVQEFLSTF